ncbi:MULTISPECIES: HAD family hydrolase [Corynebacterium]|uniref:HAD family hydrolase n=2 Tax=Corynebacteriaceae TaxID=1653 RepID=UPI0025515991|nr:MULTISPECIES: HAD family hydrolase [Corynebacterium]MDK6259446.1 HAD family hydrolase [Corynebacterium frankenforstense]MDK8895128.1 HAD family hydrolase [Corynebacterium sp. MSK006]
MNDPIQLNRPATAPEKRPRLIACDVDGTLLTSAERVSARLRAVLTRALETGAEVALATGRPHRWIYPVLEQLPVMPVCVTANGAVLYDSASDTILRRHELAPEAMSEVVGIARRELGEVAVACERSGESAFDPEESLFVVAPNYMHTWEAQGYAVLSEGTVLAEPAVKLLLRNESMTAPEMYARLADKIDPRLAQLTFSMEEGLIEVGAPGVTKALGVADLSEMHGVAQERCIAFGDMANDVEMLRWCGFGVAMGNARPEVKDAGDFTTVTNDEDGVARVLEWWY